MTKKRQRLVRVPTVAYTEESRDRLAIADSGPTFFGPMPVPPPDEPHP